MSSFVENTIDLIKENKTKIDERLATELILRLKKMQHAKCGAADCNKIPGDWCSCGVFHCSNHYTWMRKCANEHCTRVVCPHCREDCKKCLTHRVCTTCEFKHECVMCEKCNAILKDGFFVDGVMLCRSCLKSAEKKAEENKEDQEVKKRKK